MFYQPYSCERNLESTVENSLFWFNFYVRNLKHHFSKVQTTVTNLSANCLEKMPENTSETQEGVYSMMITILQSSFPSGLWVSEENMAFAEHDSLDLGLKNPGLSTCIELQATFCHPYTLSWDRQEPSGLSLHLSFQSMYLSFFYISGLNH